MTRQASITELLDAWRRGEQSAADELASVVYEELRRLAGVMMRRERSNHTLTPTALVHEAYLKLVCDRQGEFAGRAHFLAVASRVMRQVLVDYARARATRKRDANATVVLTDGAGLEVSSPMEPVELLDLDSALDTLNREDASLAQLIEMRYFGGMTAEETAEATGQSVHVVRHDLRLAQAWLRRKLCK